MAVAIRASARPLVPVGPNTVSSAYGGEIRVVVSGIASLVDAYVVMGYDNPGPPATYADMTIVSQGQVVEHAGPLTIAYDGDSGEYTVTLTIPVAPSDVSESDQVYVAMFTISGSPPGPTDAPDAVAGPFVALA